MVEPVTAIEAATLVTFRHGPAGGPPELLMVVRAREMAFAGGMAVFPGGRVDPADHALAARLTPGGDRGEAAHRIAAIRETIEETGLAPALRGVLTTEDARAMRREVAEAGGLAPVLEARGLALDLDALVPFARWCPRGMAHSRIFDTRFYLHDLGTGNVDMAVDATENTRLFWISARDALARADSGELSVIFPTRRNLERLAQFASFAEARAHAEAYPVRTIVPQLAERDGRRALTIPEDLGYPVTYEPIDSAMRG
ncbi:MAG TPA: NUDIX domain-containing protein [Qipengyuania sp.]|nr:NUDIX domain-containing protein [Qipengyuania sp.]